MLSDDELIQLWEGGESEFVEFKPSTSDKADIYHDICAFSNDVNDSDRTGVLFVGLNDDGSVTGISITEKLIAELAQIRLQGNIDPMPDMQVLKRNLKGQELAVVEVRPATEPPVRYKGRTCIRVGSVRHHATPDQENRLTERKRAGQRSYMVQAVGNAGLHDLDLDYFRNHYLPLAVAPEVIARNQRSLEQQLASLRFVQSPADPVPSILGLLTLGLDPTQHIPGAFIQFLRIDGTALGDPIKNSKRLTGRLADMLTGLENILKLSNEVAVDIKGGARQLDTPEYPLPALIQIAQNAVLHRTYQGTNAPVRVYWYNDRVEIQNPGGPFGKVNTRNFGEPGVTDYRNPELASVLANLGFAQGFGFGIATARQELERNGNPPLEFVVQPEHVLAILRKR
ncbi:MAG: putative DNA binding domain-containing protein [Flavobacteriales bacterium]|jgi:ATP-dependent DNA helicase RecG|nr:putative DNA binding domain-containing protein [Flavobacteriales bacterium]